MRLFVLLLVIFMCTEIGSASRFGRFFSSALAVHKKGKKTGITKTGEVLSKSKKVRVVSLEKLKDDSDSDIPKTKIDVVKGSDAADATVVANTIKRQASLIGRQQMFLSITRMVLSRFVFKINYKDPKTLLYARVTFVAYLALFQALLWFLSQQISKRDDTTVLHRSPSTGIQTVLSKIGALSGQSAMTSTLLNLAQLTTSASDKTTVKAHDLQQLKELTSTLYFELFTTSVVHFALGFQIPVLMAPLMGVCKLLQHPLVLLHVFRLQPVGQLERPFKNGLETFLSALIPPTASGTSAVGGNDAVSASASASASSKSEESSSVVSDAEADHTATTLPESVHTDNGSAESSEIVDQDSEDEEENGSSGNSDRSVDHDVTETSEGNTSTRSSGDDSSAVANDDSEKAKVEAETEENGSDSAEGAAVEAPDDVGVTDTANDDDAADNAEADSTVDQSSQEEGVEDEEDVDASATEEESVEQEEEEEEDTEEQEPADVDSEEDEDEAEEAEVADEEEVDEDAEDAEEEDSPEETEEDETEEEEEDETEEDDNDSALLDAIDHLGD